MQHATWAKKADLWRGGALRRKTLSLQYMCCWPCMPRGCPPCCLFVLSILTIKPRGQQKNESLYPFIDVEGETTESEKKMDWTITWIRWDNYTFKGPYKSQLRRLEFRRQTLRPSGAIQLKTIRMFNRQLWHLHPQQFPEVKLACHRLVLIGRPQTVIKPHCVTERGSQVSCYNSVVGKLDHTFTGQTLDEHGCNAH